MREKRLRVSEQVSALPSGKLSGSIWQSDAQPERGLSLPWRAWLRQVLVRLQQFGLWALLSCEGGVCWKLINCCDKEVLVPGDDDV